ncbi:acetoacetyl-CoA reductase [Dichotomicrobium thermohalophilum]|uniref:3-oxoacyl-[acyl-carrier-protein] reductase n=1 Tax=Dichotomicrobium thermohalophilum TaxID=933063 RepID=A0A397Q0Z0_9HYPH|nr:acetoacetyl-CoA reductase [Dichotomicrobium thermohalophilum]RIA55066.1 3-oxoacyl-[acyl-carrier-protein] reductase [Dichotomicrobium thermohalophilum]
MSDQGRIAVVTGGIQGLGAASCQKLAERGFKPIATHLGGGERAEAFAEETGFPVYEWDVSDVSACEDGIARIREEHGPIEVLVNNAGVNRDKMFHKMSREDWDAVLQVDLGSMFNVTRQVIGEMRERGYGRIINVSSVNAQKGQLGQTNYCAAKAGVIGFTKALARESANKGITVNALAPGYTETPMVEKVPDKIMDSIIEQVPVGRLAQPEEIARCVAFLAAEDAGFITGATLSVNGGFYMD